MKLTANIDAIALSVKNLAADAKQAASNTAQINTKLKFDSSNVSLVVERFDALGKELDANNKKLAGLRKAQEDLNAEKAKITGTDEESKRLIAEIEKLSAQYARDIEKAVANQIRLNELTSQQAKNEALIRAATQQINEKYDTWIALSEKLANATKRIYDTLKNVVSESAETGVQISALARRFNSTAEDVQVWDRALEIATGEQNIFTESMKTMVQGMSQIASGRGVAYRNALREIGVAYDEISGLDATAQFQAIAEGLAGVENYSMRAAYAQQLFGEKGQFLAGALEGGVESIEEFKEQAKEFGIISNEDAESLRQMSLQLEKAESLMDEAKAQLAIALIPALEVISDLIKNVVAPVVKSLAEGFKAMGKGGQTVALVFMGLIIILPKFIMLFASLKIAMLAASSGADKLSVSMAALNKATGVWGLVLGAIASLILIIVGALGKMSDEADKATESLNNFNQTAESMGVVGGEFTTNTEQIATRSTTYEMILNATIHGEGDTPISDENAVKVSKMVSDEVNKGFGELIK